MFGIVSHYFWVGGIVQFSVGTVAAEMPVKPTRPLRVFMPRVASCGSARGSTGPVTKYGLDYLLNYIRTPRGWHRIGTTTRYGVFLYHVPDRGIHRRASMFSGVAVNGVVFILG
jgi:hypothetical protein